MLSLERINEVNFMCSRTNPVYEQISSYSAALYVLGCMEAKDFMSIEDIDMCMASEKLSEEFEETDIPTDYRIGESKDKYLLVLGETAFPKHFAVLTNTQNDTPYFSKLDNIGSGYDSLDTLLEECYGQDGVCHEEIHYFKKI